MDELTTAFSDVLETKESNDEGKATPTPTETIKQTAEPEGKDPIDSLEAKQKEARAKWAYEKRIKELEQKLAEREKSGNINLDSDNPIKELAKTKKWSQDELVNKALEVLEEEGMTTDEAKAEVKTMSQEEIIAKVKEDLRKEQEENEQRAKSEKAISDFKESIKKFATENAEKYPLVESLGVTENVYKVIEQDYLAKADEFGDEYALKNMMKMEDAVKKVNESLASEIKTALKSENMRKFLLQAIKEESGSKEKSNQSEDDSQLEDEFATLTNDFMRQVTDPKDQRKMSNEEALADAFKYL